MSYSGRCLCGTVVYQLEGEIGFVARCHCSICRRSHGSEFATQAVFFNPRINWLQGVDQVKTYQSTPGYYRAFCQCCGARLMNYPENNHFVSLSVNSLDDVSAELSASMHVYVGSKPSAFSICDGLTQFDKLPETRVVG